MTRRFPRLLVPAAALATAWALHAAPMLVETRRELSDEDRTLRDVTALTVQVDHIAPHLKAQGVKEDLLAQAVRDRLVRAGIAVHEASEMPDTPRLVLQLIAVADPESASRAAVAIVLSVQQPVRIERLDESFTIPTSSLTRLIFTSDSDAATACRREVIKVTDFLTGLIREASR